MLNNILWTTKILQYSNVNHINVQFTKKKETKVYTTHVYI